MACTWKNFKNIFSRPFFSIIFRPEMLKFHPYSILTGDTMVGFVILCVLNHLKSRLELSIVIHIFMFEKVGHKKVSLVWGLYNKTVTDFITSDILAPLDISMTFFISDSYIIKTTNIGYITFILSNPNLLQLLSN